MKVRVPDVDDDDDHAKSELKKLLRRTLRARLRGRDGLAAGVQIAMHLAALLPATGTVAFFASREGEVDTRPLDGLLRARGLRRALPRIVDDVLVFCVVDEPAHDLPRDDYGIPTPRDGSAVVALADCDLVVVPGLGFDDGGGRIGYGRGFYDRALKDVDGDRIVGVFFDEARVDVVPMTSLDFRLPRLCTPGRGVVVVDK